MTDYTKLTERLRTDAIFDNTTLGNEAADALEAQALQLDVQAGSIEAVQAANQRLAAEVAEHKENAMRNARIAVSIRAERDQLQSKLGDAIQSSAHWQHQFSEAQAENERLKTVVQSWLKANAPNGWIDDLRIELEALQAKLDELKRQEPVTPEQVEAAWRAGWAACRDAEYVGQEAEDEAWGMSETCANADWESTAPKALAPLSRDDVKRICAEADYTHESAQSKADFINGIRHGEKAHGIGGTP